MGKFPAVSLQEARESRDAARKLLAQGADPSQQRRDDKAAALMAKTILLEVLKLPDQYIELQLGHRVRDRNGGAYNRVKYLDD